MELRGAISKLIDAIQAQPEAQPKSVRDSLAIQMRSPHRTYAERALQKAQDNGWLRDGTLRGANLRGVSFYRADLHYADLDNTELADARLTNANLFSASLVGADLRAANLTGATLQQANLSNANLQGAYLLEIDLRSADLRGAILQGARLGNADMYGARLNEWQLLHAEMMCGAFMPSSQRYDGRYNLIGDLELADFLGIDCGDPRAMADFYNVTTAEYIGGQAWASQFLEHLREDLRSDPHLRTT